MKTKKIFCAKEQIDTAHTGAVVNNGEFIFTCDCGEFIKFPAGLSAQELENAFETYKAANIGQVSAEDAEKELEASKDTLKDLMQ